MEDDNLPLRRRVPGATHAAPGASSRPVLSDAVLERMQKAIDAAKEIPDGPVTEPIPVITASGIGSREAADSAVNGASARRDRSSKTRRATKRGRGPDPSPTSKGNAKLPKINGHVPGLAAAATKEQGQPQDSNGSSEGQEFITKKPEPTPLPRRTKAAEAPEERHGHARPSTTSATTGLTARRPTAEPPRPESTAPVTSRPMSGAPASSTTSADATAALPSRTQPAGAPRKPVQRASVTSPSTVKRADNAQPEALRDWASAIRQSPSAGLRSPVGTPPPLPERSTRPRSRRRRTRTTQLIAAAAIVIAASLSVLLSQHSSAPPARHKGHQGAPEQQQAAKNASATAAWVSAQVSHNAIVSCDQRMCAALQAAGFPARNIRILTATSTYPKTSTLVIETASVRAFFGTSLDYQFAPTVLTVIGSGSTQIDVRVIAPYGAAAYQHQLNQDLQAWRSDEAAFLSTNQIKTSAQARSQLAGGKVDLRLLLAITGLAGTYPVDIVDFGNVANNASSDVPLRYADLALSDRPAGITVGAYDAEITKALKAAGQYRPSSVESVKLAGGTQVLRVAFSAPTPLGLKN